MYFILILTFFRVTAQKEISIHLMSDSELTRLINPESLKNSVFFSKFSKKLAIEKYKDIDEVQIVFADVNNNICFMLPGNKRK